MPLEFFKLFPSLYWLMDCPLIYLCINWNFLIFVYLFLLDIKTNKQEKIALKIIIEHFKRKRKKKKKHNNNKKEEKLPKIA